MRFQGTCGHHPLKKMGRRFSTEAEKIGPSHLTFSSCAQVPIFSALSNLYFLNPTCHACPSACFGLWPDIPGPASSAIILIFQDVGWEVSWKLLLKSITDRALLGVQHACVHSSIKSLSSLGITVCVVVFPVAPSSLRAGTIKKLFVVPSVPSTDRALSVHQTMKEWN